MGLVARLQAVLGDEVHDPDEDTFVLFAQPRPSALGLGCVDAAAPSRSASRPACWPRAVQATPPARSSGRPASGSPAGSRRRTTRCRCRRTPPCAALALRPRAGLYVLSDQPYVRRLVERNLSDNDCPPDARVCFRPLDWEADAVTRALAASRAGFDAVVAADCVFNEGPRRALCPDVRRRLPPTRRRR